MDNKTATKLLSNIRDRYQFGMELVAWEDVQIILKVIEYLLEKDDARSVCDTQSRVDSL
jgi:hypothetical protein